MAEATSAPAVRPGPQRQSVAQPAGPRLLAAARTLIGPSAVILAGTSSARLLGLLFSVAAARLLVPAEFGLLTYALTIVTFSSILIQNAPSGLGRYLSRHRDSVADQELYFSNWLAVVAAMLGLSLLLAVPIALAAGLSGWMLIGLLVNLVGVAIYATYYATQTGLQRFRHMTAFYVLANSLQLVATVAAGLAGLRSAALYFLIFGIANVPAVLLVQRFRPLGLRFRPELFRLGLLRVIAHFTWPQVVQTAAFTVWAGSDLVLVLHMLPRELSGGYAAARTLMVALGLAPGAICAVLTPRVAAMSAGEVRRLLAAALLMIGAIVVPGVLLTVFFGRGTVTLIFGARYLAAAQVLPVLAVGSGLYCFYLAFEKTVIGLGRPKVDALATGCAAVTTVVCGLLLIPRLGLVGAALGYAAGAAVKLAVIAYYTARLLSPRRALGEVGSTL